MYAWKIGHCDALNRAMLQGMEIAWSEIISNFIVESDSKVLIDLICQDNMVDYDMLTLISLLILILV